MHAVMGIWGATFSKNGHWLGQSPEFWGSIMEDPASLLIVLGLLENYSINTTCAFRAKPVADFRTQFSVGAVWSVGPMRAGLQSCCAS